MIPVFAAMFEDFGAELPAPTRFLIDLSDFLKGNIHWLILGAAAAKVLGVEASRLG